MIKFTKSQIASFLKLGDEYQKSDGTIVNGLLEKTLSEFDGKVAESMALSVAYGELVKDDRISVNGEIYKIAYIDDDLSGIITCHLEIAGGARGKYK
ncbi:hypothetical protein OGY20_09920 [Citrobacter sp. Cpo114]|uniref:hypothetical protein n=1 Tax=Citrobacter sp. Cpo114 TaxID=2985147 RepID=UPI00258148EF|nr:hypothetical protein [Citrobacter sp. Cpo114]